MKATPKVPIKDKKPKQHDMGIKPPHMSIEQVKKLIDEVESEEAKVSTRQDIYSTYRS
jgi:hypothetical protein